MNLRTTYRKVMMTAAFGLAFMACSNGTKFGLPAAQDNFSQSVAYNNKVDIVMIIDNSSSMDKYQQHLQNEMPALIQNLNSLKMDYHIAVITSSVGSDGLGGIFLGSPLFLTNGSPNLVASIQSRLLAGIGGSNLSRPLENFKNIFFSSYISNQGAGFLRPDALMAIITLSDDDDKSVIKATDFFQSMNTLKPAFSTGKSWLYNYIGVQNLATTCGDGVTTPTPGLKHMDLVTMTGGITTDICGPNLANAVFDIKARIIQVLTDYPLSKKPKVETIKVSINGHSIPNDATNGWTYESVTNVIRFHGTAVPAADVSIVVTFDPSQAN